MTDAASAPPPPSRLRRAWAATRAALTLRDTAIGRDTPRPVAAALAVGAVAVVAYDLFLGPRELYDDPWRRATLPLITMAVIVAALRRPAAVGVRLVPLPSGRYWLRGTLGMAVLFAVIVGGSFAIYVAGHGAVWPRDLGRPTLHYLPHTLVEAPLVEELIYRWVLITGLATLGLRWSAVLLSGAAFGYLHVKYGVAAPNNVAAGFVFAWMYLRSGHIAMPVAYHALGNLAVAGLGVVGYQLLA